MRQRYFKFNIFQAFLGAFEIMIPIQRDNQHKVSDLEIGNGDFTGAL